jgi:hypothetical protein
VFATLIIFYRRPILNFVDASKRRLKQKNVDFTHICNYLLEIHIDVFLMFKEKFFQDFEQVLLKSSER